MFDNDFHSLYPNLFHLAKLCATILVTSSECERTHSKVARVKSAVRCSMTDDRLEHLVFVNVEQDIAGSPMIGVSGGYIQDSGSRWRKACQIIVAYRPT